MLEQPCFESSLNFAAGAFGRGALHYMEFSIDYFLDGILKNFGF